MSIRNLDKLFQPGSVALIGASNRPHSVGNVVMTNLLHGGFQGPIMPVNPKETAVCGVLAYHSVVELPLCPDLAIICTPPQTVPQLIRDLADRGTRAAVVLTAGTNTAVDDSGRSATERMLEAAAKVDMRLLGPNCLGLLVPGIGLNASFAHRPALPGRIAFVSQSGALCTAVLDWARPRGIGFSHFVSMGDMADTSFGDVLDYLGSDPNTRAILLYIESIRHRQNFMSAARAAARNKPVLAIKSGRMAEGAAAAASHTGALAGADHVYNAAMKRAGMLRVYSFEELFAAVETLAHYRPLRGDRLAVVTNGGGVGVIAVDALIEMGGHLAPLSEPVKTELDTVLPATWSHANPIDIIGDAPGKRYTDTLRILMDSDDVDAILTMHVPTGITSSTEVAQSIIELKADPKYKRRSMMTCWVGEEMVGPARRLFSQAGIPTFDTPEKAVRAFMHLVNYRDSQKALMETPDSLPTEFTPATETARRIIREVIAAGREILSEPEAKAVFAAYGVPVCQTRVAHDPHEAGEIAEEMGGPVALKILSNDITHKSDVGGVKLDLKSRAEVEHAATDMLDRVSRTFPDASITGFTVQEMARRPGAHELIIGVSTDAIFGPVLLFGQGGTAVEVIKDRAVGLPPLNMNLARDMVMQTRIWALLQGYRDRPAANLDAICQTLIKISQLVCDLPEVLELDINPLFADHEGVLAVDARIRVAEAHRTGEERLAIQPYPKELEEPITSKDGRAVFVRPIRPEDEPEHRDFISRLTPEDIRFRFFGLVKELPHSELARLTQIDYAREMAFIALDQKASHVEHRKEILGVVYTVTGPDNTETEFSIVVRSDLKGTGLGRALLEKMIRYCRGRGTTFMLGQVLKENTHMLQFVEHMGFKRQRVIDDDVVEVRLTL